MAILHYTIGLPPIRNGGSVQYACDLIKEQSKTEKVLVLTCGDTLFRGAKSQIKDNGVIGNVPVYTLTNPLTPTIIYGTSDPLNQHRNIEVDYDNIKMFIISNEITILHLHSLMGLHLKIVKYIKSLGVKIIYTSHDFHGICLHYNLINQKGELCDKADPIKCARCNIHEPSDIFLRLANSSLYHTIKKTGVFKLLKKPKVQNDKSNEDSASQIIISEDRVEQYGRLIEYYREYFKLVDKFHFNSSQTKRVFQHFLPDIDGKVIPVITSGIRDRRKSLNLSKEIKFGFIGSLNEYKGFPMLKKILLELYNEGYSNFKLLAYPGNVVGKDTDCPLIEYQPPYNYSQISDIMYGLDCVIIPSKWYETFSLVALEALAHGRPVIASDHVGANDIIKTFSPDMIFTSPEYLKSTMKKILENPDILRINNDYICENEWLYTLENHVKEVMSYYNE